jgi:caffeoyl-CoA O-methyltransferase
MNNIEDYCQKYSSKESNLLSEIKDYTFKNEEAPQMISGPLVGNLINMLITVSNAKIILEIGMFTGYSALNIAENLPDDGEVHTCEIMDRHIKTADNFFKKSPHYNKFIIHTGDALNSLEKFKINMFDFAFIDGDKINYINYYNRCMQIVKNNGIIVLDNMLWGGSVLNPKDEQSKTLNQLAQIIDNDDRNINMLLPIRDGIMVCIKK